MKKHFSALIGFSLWLLLLALPREIGWAMPISEQITITVTPQQMRPADGGFIRVAGDYPMLVEVTLDEDSLPVFWNNGAYMAYFAFPFEEPAGIHALEVEVYDPGSQSYRNEVFEIEVVDYDFQQEEVEIPFSLLGLFDPDLNKEETALIDEIYTSGHVYATADWPLNLPTLSPVITSRFGNDRVYGGGLWRQHHTGVDFRLGKGEPVLAVSDGWVVYSATLDVHGNFIVIDHGNGLMTSYSHLSEKIVKEGMYVRTGQVIGLGGNTGRSAGPHLHLEMCINGTLIDPIRFMALNPSFVTPIEVKPEVKEPGD